MDEKNLFSEIKKLAELQATLAKLLLGKSVRESKQIVKTGISSMSNYLDEEAKKYGREKKEVEKLKGDHKEYTQDLRDKYLNGVMGLEELKQDSESQLLYQIGKALSLKMELKEKKKTPKYDRWEKAYKAYKRDFEIAKKAGDTEKMTKVVYELRRMRKESPTYDIENEIKSAQDRIKELESDIKVKKNDQKELKNNFKSDIDIAGKSKSKALTQIKKQNFFQKFIGSITSKVNGGKKLAQAVINPVSQSLKEFKEETIPQFAADVKKKAGEKVDEVKSFGKSVKERVEGVISRGKQAKDNIINGFEEKITNMKEKTQEKINEINNQER